MKCEHCGKEIPEEHLKESFGGVRNKIREIVIVGYKCPFCEHETNF